MTGLLRSEWIKLRSVRTTWILAGLALAIEAVFLILVSSLVPADEFGDGTADTLTGLGLGFLLILVLGAIAFTNEYRHATTTSTYLVTPDRAKVLAAKLIVVTGFGMAVGVAFAILSAGIARTIFSSRDVPVPEGSDLWVIIVGAILAYGLGAAFGTALGAVVRNQVGTIVSAIAIFFVLGSLGLFIGEDVAAYLPSQASAALQGSAFDQSLLGQVPGGLVFLGYVVLLAVIGAVLVRRSDVTE